MKVRVAADSKVHPGGFNADPDFGVLFIDDGTGFVSASTPTAEVVDASPVTAGECSSGVTATVASGKLTVSKPGTYLIQANIGHILGGNASVMVVDIYKNGAAFASSASRLGGALQANLKMQATAAADSVHLSGVRELDKDDYLQVVVTGSVGTVTIKNMSFHVVQLIDA